MRIVRGIHFFVELTRHKGTPGQIRRFRPRRLAFAVGCAAVVWAGATVLSVINEVEVEVARE
jgi:hypothetical protein